MEKIVLLLSFTFITTSFAECINLSGRYKMEDISKQCTSLHTHEELFSYKAAPFMQIMAIPGPKYGYFLQRVTPKENEYIDIEQVDCKSIKVKVEGSEKNLLIESGQFQYFGARSPILVNTSINDAGLSQKMNITKYTTINAGKTKVYKNILYNSSIKINENKDLVIKAEFRFGKGQKKLDSTSCIFKSF